ncbi:50S ribosomal protein L35ae [Candidatus Woesearchaeota archaeon]|nr:50S ribosomal protein L35ae [Candidatus Woesearchaeota archaeon]
MEGVIVHYRQNRHTTDGNQLIVQPKDCNSREEAEKFVGKKVSWNTGKQDLTGTIASAHGGNGAVRVVFDKGMPGQSLGKKVIIN